MSEGTAQRRMGRAREGGRGRGRGQEREREGAEGKEGEGRTERERLHELASEGKACRRDVPMWRGEETLSATRLQQGCVLGCRVVSVGSRFSILFL